MQKQNRTKDIYIRGRKDPNMGSCGYNHLIFNTTTFWKKRSTSSSANGVKKTGCPHAEELN